MFAAPLFAQLRPLTPEEIQKNQQLLEDSRKQFIKSLYSTQQPIFESEDFNSGSGSIIRADHVTGMTALVNRAGTDDAESAWLFLPQYQLWINTTTNVSEARSFHNKKILEFVFDHTKNIESWHTHVDAEYNDGFYTAEQMRDFGPSLYFIPTQEDVCALMQNTIQNPSHTYTSSIASSRGALQMFCAPMEFDFSHPYVQKFFYDFCKDEFYFIRDHFRGTSETEFAGLAATYKRTIKLTFIKPKL